MVCVAPRYARRMVDAPETKRAPSGTLPLDDAADAVTLRREKSPATAETLVAPSTGSEPKVVDPSPVSFEAAARYADRKLLGQGGMGEVRLCADAWIGREVAMKVMRQGSGSQASARARFLREARVQGQLEHPSIVPVYDMGVAAEGGTFFTMKRVKGHTLEEIIVGLRDGDATIVEEYTRRKLLAAMARVCLTVAYAHTRGVVHRDLKPANVMLGDFGEVYVLDWGVAKITGEAELELDGGISGEGASEARTQVGALVGTPGYMAPEQARGETDAITGQADVYALGAILFEVLALTPLHHGKSLEELLIATMTGVDGSPAKRAPEADIAPELDAVCVRATAMAPEDRFASAREMHDAIEGYLDGERDAEKRKELAHAHLAEAESAMAAARDGGEDGERQRARAMRELGRVLALDPQHEGALGALMEFVTSAPDELSPDAEAALKDIERADRARSARRAAIGFLAWYSMTPLVLWMGVMSWGCVLAVDLAVTAVIAYFWWMGKTGNAGPRYMRVALVLNFTLVSLVSLITGPFVLVPGVAIAVATVSVVSIRANQQTRRMITLMAVSAVLIPAALQGLGLARQSYAFEDGVVKILPLMASFSPLPTYLFLLGGSVLQIVLGLVLLNLSMKRLLAAERRNFAQAWRLKQLLPAAA